MADESTRILTAADRPPALRNPWVAAGASFLLPGAGQALNGRFWKGTLLLVLSFVILPGGWMSFIYFHVAVATAILPFVLLPWLYSIAEAAREANRLNQQAEPFNSRKSAMYVSLLLLVVFPVVAIVFSCVTLLMLPEEVINQIEQRTRPIADWAEPF